MPINVYWDYRDVLVMRFDLSGAWQWQELIEASQESLRLLDEIGPSTHHYVVVYNSPESKAPNGGLLDVRKLLSGINNTHSILVNVGGDTLALKMLMMLQFLSPRLASMVKTAKTLEDAYALCSRIEQSFAPSSLALE